jgi:hypothetical protein
VSLCQVLQGCHAGSKHPRYYDTEACAVCAAAMLMARMLGNVQVNSSVLLPCCTALKRCCRCVLMYRTKVYNTRHMRTL